MSLQISDLNLPADKLAQFATALGDTTNANVALQGICNGAAADVDRLTAGYVIDPDSYTNFARSIALHRAYAQAQFGEIPAAVETDYKAAWLELTEIAQGKRPNIPKQPDPALASRAGAAGSHRRIHGRMDRRDLWGLLAFFLFALLFVSRVTLATPVFISLQQLNITPKGDRFTLLVDATNNPYTDGTNLFGGGTIQLTPANGTNIVNLQPAGYTLLVPGWSRSLHFVVPQDTNMWNVVNLITNGLSSLTPITIAYYNGTNAYATNAGYATAAGYAATASNATTAASVPVSGLPGAGFYFGTSPSQFTNVYEIANAEYSFVNNLPLNFSATCSTNGMLVWTNTAANGLPVFLVWNDPDWNGGNAPTWTVQTNLPDTASSAIYLQFYALNRTNLVGPPLGWWQINPLNSPAVSTMNVLGYDYAVRLNDTVVATNVVAGNASFTTAQADTVSAQFAGLQSIAGTFTGPANLTGGNVVTNLALPQYNLVMFPAAGLTNVVIMYTSSCATNFFGVSSNVVFTDTNYLTPGVNATIRDPSHFLYTDNSGKATWILTWSHYSQVWTNWAFGMATNSVDSNFVFKAYVTVTNAGASQLWSPKLFTDATNGLHVSYIMNGDQGPANYFQIADLNPVTFTLSNQRTLNGVGNSSQPYFEGGSEIYFANGTYFLFGPSGEWASSTLSSNGWALFQSPLLNNQQDGFTLVPYLGSYYLFSTYLGFTAWTSHDLTNWTTVPAGALNFPADTLAEGDGTIALIPVPPSGINVAAVVTNASQLVGGLGYNGFEVVVTNTAGPHGWTNYYGWGIVTNKAPW